MKRPIKPVKNQHLMSQALARGWCVDRVLDRLTLRSGFWRSVGPGGFGKADWFVRAEFSAAMEDVWRPVEQSIPEARAFVQAIRPLTTEVKDMLRNIMALHLIRNMPFSTIFSTLPKRLQERRYSEPVSQEFLAQHFFRTQFGVEYVGEEGREIAHQLVLNYFEEKLGTHSDFFVERLKFDFLRLRTTLSKWEVEIGICSRPDTFILGDNPAVTIDVLRRLVTISAGVSPADAHLLVMPISPTRCLSLRTSILESEYLPVPSNLFSTWQAVAASKHVGATPRSGHDIQTDHYVQVWRHREGEDPE